MMGKKRAMLLGLDGADPVVIKRLMAEGRMPNLEKLLKEGTATESLSMMGVFPTVTPPNWTTLATGNWPKTHGITCFQNHTLGKSLNISEYNWDSRRIESELIWEAMEDEGKRCIMLNYCQAWPNRVKDSKNIFIDGTGMVPFLRSSADFQKYVYLDAAEEKLREIPHTVRNSSGDCVVYGDQAEKATKVGGDDLESVAAGHHFTAGEYVADTPMLEQETFVMYNNSVEEAANGDVIDKQYAPIKDAKNWSIEIPENAREAVYVMNSGLDRRHILLTASNGKDYDTLSFHKNKKSEAWTSAKAGEWTDWIYDTFLLNDKPTSVAYKIRVVAIDPTGNTASFYLSHTMNLENDSYFYPRELGHEIFEALGPAMYFGTFFRHSDIGDQVVVETWQQNHQWQANAAKWLFHKYPDWQLFYIHLHSIDLMNHWYINQAIPGSHLDWQRHKAAIEKVYEINDAFIGEMMEYLDGDTTIFVVSDHAATPRSPGYKNPGIGELSGINAKVMEELGYTVVNKENAEKGWYTIDWTKTRAVNMRTSHIYVNLKGRDPEGIVEPEDYDALVQQIISDLYAYRDPVHGERVVSFAMTREEMECVGMGGKHCGDIFFQLRPDFQFEHANCPNEVTNNGYSVGCVCIMGGAGIKKGYTMKRPVRNVDIVPTICHLLGNRMPHEIEGGVIYQALEETK